MSDVSPAIPLEIPNRALFKASEVCDLIKLQPYVLRSWEAEFPTLGVSKSAGSARVYRRSDVEQVARIKHLLLVEGLTLAGVRRKLEEESTPVLDEPAINELLGRNARERLTAIKQGLRSILDLLGSSHGAREFRLSAPALAPMKTAASRPRAATPARGKPSRHKPAPARSRSRKRT
jgi:DNA-binding transcriptional MerR regulator